MLDKSNLAVGWTMASDIEAYLDRFDAVQRLAERISGVAETIGTVSNLLAGDSKRAFAAIPNDWPTQEELRALLTDFESAKAQLQLYWHRLAEKVRSSMPTKRPEMAGQAQMCVPYDKF
jgi:hypothetical protein